MKEQEFYIAGMTCSGCERTLERAVSQLEGVQAAEAVQREGVLRVSYELPCTEAAIVQAVENAGYSVADAPQRRDGVYLLVILLGLYLIARQLGWTDVFQAVPAIGREQIGTAALFLAGLLTSVHCIAMCGGMNLAQSMSWEAHPFRRSVLYNLGRLTSYTLIGGVLGWVGERAAMTLQMRGAVGLAAGVLMLLLGLKMLGVCPLPKGVRLPVPQAVRRGMEALRRHGPFAIGLANGLMPCGPLQSMQIYAVASGSWMAGAVSMFVFCLGTIPLVLLFGTVAGTLRIAGRRRLLQLGAALLVLLGLFTVQNNLALTGVLLPSAGRETPAAVAVVDGGTQYLTTNLRANGFTDIQVTAGIPVEWTITADAASLNGCNREVVFPFLGEQVTLTEGENTITFTPETAGTFSYSCWMGMLRSTVTVVAA